MPKPGDGRLEKSMCALVWLGGWTSCFSTGDHFYLKEGLINSAYSDLDIWQMIFWKWMKWICHCKKNSWWYLLPVIFEFSRENKNFGKFVSATIRSTASQNFKDFLMQLVVMFTDGWWHVSTFHRSA